MSVKQRNNSKVEIKFYWLEEVLERYFRILGSNEIWLNNKCLFNIDFCDSW